VVLPAPENMNSGKTHAFFTWASKYAWVPPVQHGMMTATARRAFSYSNTTSDAPPLASHDPGWVWRDVRARKAPERWVRPDFVIKADDDSFVMLAELEARLRVELYAGTGWFATARGNGTVPASHKRRPALADDLPAPAAATGKEEEDPLIYWGYLVKNRFMGGELYALSWSVVAWVAREPAVRALTSGAEDKQTAKWMRLHPRAREVRWASERCWIYDHPRAGTVYGSLSFVSSCLIRFF
jgi:hypothetical protein